MRTEGRIEARAGEEVNSFMQRAVGRGASTVTATLRQDALYVHLHDVLTPAERRLASSGGAETDRGESMVREVRDHLVRSSRGELAAALAGIIGRVPTAVLHDVDPGSGHEVIAFFFRPPPSPTRP